ncbi:hypothetical protein PGT21_021495 [Puccinia graminis f. sp. tritici]|uniref:Uncharacterized protein n=1 Tax=Puccinia graminis f. sp. tritici TaxID=56615 RepID=A0A5B0PRK7_PUCGR|nr:hypothetical protein PGT21_021495 [Puccinia graminis f. sp. tritici]
MTIPRPNNQGKFPVCNQKWNQLSALIEETKRPTAPLMQETKRPGPASPQPLLTESIFLDEEDGLNKFG